MNVTMVVLAALASADVELQTWVNEGAGVADEQVGKFADEIPNQVSEFSVMSRVRALTSRGLSLYPRCGSLQAQLGACAFASGCLAEAATTFSEAVQGEWGADSEGLTRALASLSTVYLGLNQNDKALSSASEAIRRGPEWASAHYLAGQALERMWKMEEAREEFRQVLKLSPGHAGATAALGRLEGK